MRTIRVSKQTFTKMIESANPDCIAFELGLYNPVQHHNAIVNPRSIYLIDVGSNLHDASVRIMIQK